MKLERIAAWLQRYKQNVRCVISGSVTTNKNKLLSVTQPKNAELELLKHVQKFVFPYSSPEVDF